MFRPEWFNQTVRTAPYNARRVFAIDRAATQDGGCYTAGVLLARDSEGKCYVEDVMHGQWEPDERNNKILSYALKYRRMYGPKHVPLILIEAEGGASGKDAFKTLSRKLAGFRVRETHVTGSKDVRAEGWADYLSGGNVWLVDGDGSVGWDVQGFIEEHVRFRPEPGKRLGGHKDRVDASTLAYNYLFGVMRSPDSPILRRVDLKFNKKGLPVRFIVPQSPDELTSLILREPTLLIYCCDPSPRGIPDPIILPQHALEKLTASVILSFADLTAEELLPVWTEPVPAYDKLPEQVLISKEQGRKLWASILKRYDPPVQYVVFVGENESDGRPLSVAMAVADHLRYKREEVFLIFDESDVRYKGEPPNRYVYDVVKLSRGSVIG